MCCLCTTKQSSSFARIVSVFIGKTKVPAHKPHVIRVQEEDTRNRFHCKTDSFTPAELILWIIVRGESHYNCLKKYFIIIDNSFLDIYWYKYNFQFERRDKIFPLALRDIPQLKLSFALSPCKFNTPPIGDQSLEDSLFL